MKQDKSSKYIDQLMPHRDETWHDVETSIERYLFAAQFAENKTLLDVACGSGYGSSYLKGNAKKVVGGDISKPAIQYATSHYRKDGLHFLLLDAQQLPFPNSTFDLIVSMETVEHLPEYEQFLIECQRVLKEAGVFVCSTPNKAILSPRTNKPHISTHFKEFYPQEFYHLLKRYFEQVTLYGHEPLSKINRIYFRLRKPLAPIICAIPFISQIRKILDFPRHLFSSPFRPTKLEEIAEGDFANFWDEKRWVSPIQGDSPPTWTIIGIAKKPSKGR